MRIRMYRVALFGAWLVVSLLAVAGFAAFQADEEAASPEPTESSGTDLGRNAGAVAALSFSFHVEDPPPASTTTDPDQAVQDQLDARAQEVTPSTEAEEDRSGAFIRSRYMQESEVRALISRFFLPEDVNKAVRVAWCESSFNPNAINPTSGAAGLFQHLPEHWDARSAAAGYPGADIFDPEANVAVAAWLLYESPGGWTHWSCNA